MKMELRMAPMNIETTEDGSLKVSGYVNKTEQWSELLGRRDRFKEKISKGAFTRAIDKSNEIHFLAEHDGNKILSSTRNNSLELREDEVGLFMSAEICPTSWGKDYYELIKSGILNNMSFGFRAVKDAWKKVDGYFERTVNELELFEVSVVRDPAYSQSSISARGIDLVEDEVPSSELNLRTIEIRSDADIEAIAKKLFEMITNNAKIAEGHEKDETAEEKTEEVVETEETVEVNEEISDTETKIEEDSKELDVEEPVEKTEETEIVETEANTQTEADKIRDFIKKYKEV
jgi:HK97 family phage prohead protease